MALVRAEESRMTARGYQPKVLTCTGGKQHVHVQAWW